MIPYTPRRTRNDRAPKANAALRECAAAIEARRSRPRALRGLDGRRNPKVRKIRARKISARSNIAKSIGSPSVNPAATEPTPKDAEVGDTRRDCRVADMAGNSRAVFVIVRDSEDGTRVSSKAYEGLRHRSRRRACARRLAPRVRAHGTSSASLSHRPQAAQRRGVARPRVEHHHRNVAALIASGLRAGKQARDRPRACGMRLAISTTSPPTQDRRIRSSTG